MLLQNAYSTNSPCKRHVKYLCFHFPLAFFSESGIIFCSLLLRYKYPHYTAAPSLLSKERSPRKVMHIFSKEKAFRKTSTQQLHKNVKQIIGCHLNCYSMFEGNIENDNSAALQTTIYSCC